VREKVKKREYDKYIHFLYGEKLNEFFDIKKDMNIFKEPICKAIEHYDRFSKTKEKNG